MMLKYLIMFTVSLLYISSFSQDACFKWAKTFESEGYEKQAAMVVDEFGNSYSTGTFSGLTDFNPGPAVYSLDPEIHDVFILKLDSLGNFIWCKSIGNEYYTEVFGICLDEANNVLITGHFTGSIDLDPGLATHIIDGHLSTECFILKMDESGDFIWGKSFGGEGQDKGKAITTDSENNVYTTGVFEETVDFDPNIGIFELSTADAYSNNVFLQKLDSDGNFIWVKSVECDDANTITVDNSDNIFFGGEFYYDQDLDPGVGIDIKESNGGSDCYIIKMNAAGEYQWSRTFGGEIWDLLVSIAVDSDDNIYAFGSFNETVDLNPGGDIIEHISAGENDNFVLKLNNEGEYLWSKSFGGESVDEAYMITLDSENNCYLIGLFTEVVDFDPGLPVNELTAFGEGGDLYILKLSQTGDFLWIKSFDSEYQSRGKNLGLDGEDNLYVGGEYYFSVDVHPGLDVFMLDASYGIDIFIVKFDNCTQEVYSDINNSESVDGMQLYPNPASNLININLDGLGVGQATEALIYNLQGNLVRKCPIVDRSIRLNNLASGNYFITINTPSKTFRSKIIVQH